MKVSQLFRFPVKSMQGESLAEAEIGMSGILGDREWMVVDEEGLFVTQRTALRLGAFAASWIGDRLKIRHRPTGDVVVLPSVKELAFANITASIWERSVDSRLLQHEVNGWLSQHLRKKVSLVWSGHKDGYEQKIAVSPGRVKIQFPDACPILVLGSESLLSLNERLDKPVGHDRFRPNIVISTDNPHQEDGWVSIHLPHLQLQMVKPCQRCVIVATDQDKARLEKEPLATLNAYRKFENKVNFGMYATPVTPGSIRIGDELIDPK
jgi:uncharacterized protein